MRPRARRHRRVYRSRRRRSRRGRKDGSHARAFRTTAKLHRGQTLHRRGPGLRRLPVALRRKPTQRYIVGDPMDRNAYSSGRCARDDLREALDEQISGLGGARRANRSRADRSIDSQRVSFFEPTVVADVCPGCAMFDEEIFGPAAAVVSARTSRACDRACQRIRDFGLGGEPLDARHRPRRSARRTNRIRRRVHQRHDGQRSAPTIRRREAAAATAASSPISASASS